MKYSWLLILPVLLFISCNDKKTQPITEEQWKVFSYLPGDTEFLMYANLGVLRETEHWKKLPAAPVPGENNWLSEFEKNTGTGLNKGVSEIYTATTWGGNNIIAVTFNENLNRIKDYFNDSLHFIQHEVKGKTVYYNPGTPETGFYFADEAHLLIIKDPEYLAEVIKMKNQSIKENKKFIGIISGIPVKDQYWIATSKGTYAADLIRKLTGINKDFRSNKIISSIDNITLSADFTDDVKIESVIGCKDEKNAYLLSAGIRSAIAMDLFAGGDSFISGILHNLDIERNNKTLNLELTLTDKDILEFKKRHNNL